LKATWLPVIRPTPAMLELSQIDPEGAAVLYADMARDTVAGR
jgi:hypothetical protein